MPEADPPPLPVAEPEPEPIPVQALAYTTPVPASNRPGIITAIGVLSIVIGSLGILSNGMWALYAIIIYAISGAMGALAAKAPPTPVPAASVVVEERIGTRGFDAEERAIVISGFKMARALSEPRQQQLDLLLRESGQDILLLAPEGMTAQTVSANISDSGRTPSASGGVGPDFFVVGEGRLEIWDDHAVFAPSDGRPSIRVEATGPAGAGGFTDAQIQAVIAQAQSLSGNKLNAAQQKALAQQLQSPGQRYVTNASTPQLTASQVVMAIAQFDGSVTVTTNTGGWNFDPNGVVASSWLMSPGGGWTTTTTGGGTTTLAAPANTFANLNRGALTLIAFESLASLGLAILLLIAGILVLRQNPRGRWLHFVYAWLKIPLAIVAGLGVWWFGESISTSATSAAGSPLSWFIVLSLVLIVIGVAYPIGVMIVLRSRAVRDYYAAAAG